MDGVVERLVANVLQLFVLLGCQNRLHLRVSLLMDRLDLLRFLDFRDRIVGLDLFYLRSFVGENRQNLSLLFGCEIKLLRYGLRFCPGLALCR